jgi:hypothetical protein
MVPMRATYSASRPVASDRRDVIDAAVRAATEELRETLHSHGIDVSFDELAQLGHSESWDDEGQRWVNVDWEGAEAG